MENNLCERGTQKVWKHAKPKENQKKNGLKMNVNSYKWMMLSLIDILFVQV